MRKKRTAARVFFILTLLSLPLCCLAAMAFAPNPLFMGEFNVANESNETLYVTPIGESYGQRHVLVKSFSKFPYVPILKRSDIRLEPGESVHIVCETDEDLVFSEIAVRNTRGEFRQLVVQQPTIELSTYSSSPSTYVVESFAELEAIPPQALEVAEKARGVNAQAWAMMLLGLIPFGMFAAWLRVARDLRQESQRE